ncbi:hypothetical protein [Leifsonia sp. WHRI 6310E]|uniref:hypothetical protein n=1 Tax=Leifsonia sp. WHRI 6310E TaxID=3162562 RepID=UPI0032F0744B
MNDEMPRRTRSMRRAAVAAWIIGPVIALSGVAVVAVWPGTAVDWLRVLLLIVGTGVFSAGWGLRYRSDPVFDPAYDPGRTED